MAETRTVAHKEKGKLHLNIFVKPELFQSMFNVAKKLNMSRSFVADAVFDRLCTGLTEEKVVDIVLNQIAARAKGKL